MNGSQHGDSLTHRGSHYSLTPSEGVKRNLAGPDMDGFILQKYVTLKSVN